MAQKALSVLAFIPITRLYGTNGQYSTLRRHQRATTTADHRYVSQLATSTATKRRIRTVLGIVRISNPETILRGSVPVAEE